MQISFGAMAKPLHKQLGFDEKEMEWYQKMADAITLLSIQQILCDSETHKARGRLIKRMTKDLLR